MSFVQISLWKILCFLGMPRSPFTQMSLEIWISPEFSSGWKQSPLSWVPCRSPLHPSSAFTISGRYPLTCEPGPQRGLTHACPGLHGGTLHVGSCSWPRIWHGFTLKYLIVLQWRHQKSAWNGPRFCPTACLTMKSKSKGIRYRFICMYMCV